MVKSPNNLQISVPLSIRDKLQMMAVDNESVSLVAKRVLLEALGENSDSQPPSIAPDALKEIRDRMDAFDNAIQRLDELESRDSGRSEYVAEVRDRLNQLEKDNRIPSIISGLEYVSKQASDIYGLVQSYGDRLNQLEKDQPEFHESMKNLVERLENLEGWISSLRDDRALAKCSLGKFSDRLDALEKGKVQAAPREIPTGLSHSELAEKLGVNRSTVSRWGNDRDKWPEGYMWSNESKKWFPLEV